MRGYDVSHDPATWKARLMIVKVFLNIVLDDAVEEKDGGEKIRLGMVVRTRILSSI